MRHHSAPRDARRLVDVLHDLAQCDRVRRGLITELRAAGYVRGRNLVAELGEWLAARYYGVPLAPPKTPGYDLVHEGRRVQVRAIRDTPENPRSVLGAMKEPYDVLLALRLDEDFQVTDALEVPRLVLDQAFPNGRRVTWSRAISDDRRTRRLPADDFNRLLAGG